MSNQPSATTSEAALIARLEVEPCDDEMLGCRANWPTSVDSWCLGCVSKEAAEVLASALSALREAQQGVKTFPCPDCGEPIIMPHVLCQTCICKQCDKAEGERDALAQQVQALKAANASYEEVFQAAAESQRQRKALAQRVATLTRDLELAESECQGRKAEQGRLHVRLEAMETERNLLAQRVKRNADVNSTTSCTDQEKAAKWSRGAE